MDQDLRNSLWSALKIHYWDNIRPDTYTTDCRLSGYGNEQLLTLCRRLWLNFSKNRSTTYQTAMGGRKYEDLSSGYSIGLGDSWMGFVVQRSFQADLAWICGRRSHSGFDSQLVRCCFALSRPRRSHAAIHKFTCGT